MEERFYDAVVDFERNHMTDEDEIESMKLLAAIAILAKRLGKDDMAERADGLFRAIDRARHS